MIDPLTLDVGAASGHGIAPPPDWAVVDEGWGRKAVDFATLSEPCNCREYITVHHRLAGRVSPPRR
jgi:hypothetical protein